jgi:hypothetical protein
MFVVRSCAFFRLFPHLGTPGTPQSACLALLLDFELRHKQIVKLAKRFMLFFFLYFFFCIFFSPTAICFLPVTAVLAGADNTDWRKGGSFECS